MKTDTTIKGTEILGAASGKAVEAMAMWAEANQRVLRELVDLWVGTAKESVRLYAELQQGAIDAVRESQATALTWQDAVQDAPKDPMQWYQKALTAMTRSAERLQTSAEQAGKGIQETVEATVLRMKDAYTQN